MYFKICLPCLVNPLKVVVEIMMLTLGVDPGCDGAAVLLDEQFRIVGSESFKRAKEMWRAKFYSLVNGYIGRDDIQVFVEDVGARPGQGVVSMFNFGVNVGVVQGLLQACGLEYELIRPQIWQALAWDDGPDGEWVARFRGDPKKRSNNSAMLYWGSEVFKGVRGGVDSGLCDAALIARGGMLLMKEREIAGAQDRNIEALAIKREHRRKLDRQRKRKARSSAELRLTEELVREAEGL